MRTVRIPDELWDAAGARAAREDLSLSQLIRRWLRAYAAGTITLTDIQNP